MKKTVCALLMALAVIGCNKSENNENVNAAYEAKSETVNAVSDGSSAKNASVNESAETPVHQEQKIIKNADLRFETKSLDTTATGINTAIKKYRGLLQNDSQEGI